MTLLSNVNIIERRAYRDGASSTGMRKAFRGGWWARLAVLVPLVLAAGAKKNVLLITLDAFSGRDPWLQGLRRQTSTPSSTGAPGPPPPPLPLSHCPCPQTRTPHTHPHHRGADGGEIVRGGFSPIVGLGSALGPPLLAGPGLGLARTGLPGPYVQAPQCCLTRYLNLSSRSTYSEKAYPPACPSFRHPFHKRSRSWGGGGVVGTHLGCCIVRHRACGGVVDRTRYQKQCTLNQGSAQSGPTFASACSGCIPSASAAGELTSLSGPSSSGSLVSDPWSLPAARHCAKLAQAQPCA